jgi:Fe-S cluster assembly scaffold protein SufB
MTKLSENLIREISAKRNEPEWLLQWRLDAYSAWKNMTEPHWADIDYTPIDYDALNYYNEPGEIDNSDLESVYDKMGLPENEKRALMGMATDTVIDSRSVHTSYTAELEKLGIIFMPFSDAVIKHPDLIKKYLPLLNDIEQVYVFGSALDPNRIPSDIDILIIYSEYSSTIQRQIEKFERQLENESELPIDLTILSFEEEHQVGFLERVSAVQLK